MGATAAATGKGTRGLDTAIDNLAGSGDKRPPLRDRLLDLAYLEIYENGFSGLRVDALIAKAGSTKGAFYHHFPSKMALGYAVVDELLAGLADRVWNQHLGSFDDPIVGIEESAKFAMMELGPRCNELGCPFNNLAQEMSAVDEGFRQRMSRIFATIIGHIAAALRRGQAEGFVRKDIDPDVTASFVFAALEGTMGVTKAMGTLEAFDTSMQGMVGYLATLRP